MFLTTPMAECLDIIILTRWFAMLGEGRIQVRLFQYIGIFCSTTKMKHSALFQTGFKKKRKSPIFCIWKEKKSKIFPQKRPVSSQAWGYSYSNISKICITIHISRVSVKPKAWVKCSSMLLVQSHNSASWFITLTYWTE